MGFSRSFLFGAAPAAALTGGVAAALLFSTAQGTPASAQSKAPVSVAQPSGSSALSLQDAFMKVADTVGPATVYIQTKTDLPSRFGGGPQMILPFDLGPFGGGPDGSLILPFGNRRRGGGGGGSDDGSGGTSDTLPRGAVQSSGSGVIVRPDGYVLTNDHVVDGARNGEVTVILADGTKYEHCKVFRDYQSDLAVVKVNAGKPLPYVRFADSGRLHVGQWAIAIGAPYGEQNSMTTGIVSALNRKTAIGSGSDARYYPSLIQTDASINPGNSGGPLLNIEGELIGVNVAIESPSGSSAGIGFAIPANAAKSIMEQLVAKGAVTRSTLGITPVDVPLNLRDRLGVSEGSYVRQVVAGTPADKAGIQPGDVITKVGSKPVTDEVSLRDAVSNSAPNTTVPITLVRGGKTLTVNATLAAQDKPVASAAPAEPAKRRALDLGFAAQTLTPEVIAASNTPAPSSRGVVVTQVAPGSAALDGELGRGDVIVAANGKPVPTTAALDAVIAAAKPGDVLSLTVLRWDQDHSGWDRAVADITVP